MAEKIHQPANATAGPQMEDREQTTYAAAAPKATDAAVVEIESGPEKIRPVEPRPKEPRPVEHGGPKGLEPTRYGDWEKNGRCTDF